MSLTSKERNLDKGASPLTGRSPAAPPQRELSLKIRVSPAGTPARSGGDAVGVGCSAGLETPGATTAVQRERTACQPKQRRFARHGTGYLCPHILLPVAVLLLR